MTSNLGRALSGALIALTALASAPTAFAQESTNQVAVMTDWSVFTEPKEGTPADCWGVAKPKESVNTRDGAPVTARRGDILMFVTYHAGGGGKGEVSFTGGYPFAPGSTVTVDIDGSKFELFTDGEFAWTANGDEDAAVLAAMKKGTTAILSAHSAKGTQTVDTVSLRGFTAAMDDAAKRCQ